MKFSKFASYLQKLELTSSRNKIIEIIAGLFKQVSSPEIDKVCYLSLGRLAPKFAGIEFNLAEKTMIKVITLAYELEDKMVREEYKKAGDLGDVVFKLKVQEAKRKATAKSLKPSIVQVYNQLLEIAQESGEGSVERKISKTAELLRDLDPLSAKYVSRIPLGKLRLGFSDMTILDSLSWMIAGDKSKRKEIEDAYNIRADVGQIAKKLKTQNLKPKKLKEFLGRIKPQVGTPIVPALCQRLPTAEEMIEKMGEVAVEPKYDGTRLQVHFSKKQRWEHSEGQLDFDFRPKGFVRTFTRNLENTTHMFPDLVERVFEEVKAKEAILDCEAIGYNPKTGKFLPFQETIKRKRKHGVTKKAKEIPLKFFCFDILYKDGQDLLKTPLSQRRKILEKILYSNNKVMILSPQIVTDDPKRLRKYHDEQIKNGLEGVVVKKWQAFYEPGRRGFTWVKFKQEKGKKGGGLVDTLDCLVMGYYKGRGKRAGFGIGAFLVGINGGEEFLTISKIGTGLSDEQWREMKVRGSKFEVRGKPKEYKVDKNLTPDVWCRPGIMVEIEADNITKSPIHTAGYALRFPRLVRFRDDKNPEQATTLEELKKLFKLQK